MKIYAFHLLNDFSGSPKVLMQLAKGWTKNGIEVHLVTSSGRTGFLSDIEGVTYHKYWYKWAANPFLRLFNLSLSQLFLICKLFFKVKRKDIIYINTVLPFGAAFLGKMKRCKVIYHVHETTMKPPILKKFLFGVAKCAANDAIYVSKFLLNQEPFKKSTNHILYNAIEDQYLEKAIKNRVPKENLKKVLMVCSLKDYKGVNEFVWLANKNEQFQFQLVLNTTREEIDAFFDKNKLSRNLEIFATQTDLHPFYKNADVILNLSRPDGWVETFGLTIIEGMAYGLPAIVPPVGGITEIVEENKNGFLIDCRDNELLNKKLNEMFDNSQLYQEMSIYSKEKINQFSEKAFIKKSIEILNQ